MEELKKKEKDLLDIIEEHQPICKYRLWKRSNYQSYSSVWNILEILRVKELIIEKKSMTEENRGTTLIMIKKIKR